MIKSAQNHATVSLLNYPQNDTDEVYFSHYLWFAKGALEISLSNDGFELVLCFCHTTMWEYVFFYLFCLVNLQFSNHVMEVLRGIPCGLLYTGTKHTEQMSLYAFRLRPHLFTEKIMGHYFSLSLRGKHIWMFGQYFICARPTNALHQFLLAFVWKSIDLLASKHFWTLTVEKQISSQRECWFVSILAACQVCNSQPDWIPRWTEAISAGQTDESKASNEISVGVCLSGQNGVGELSVKVVFGLDSVSLLLNAQSWGFV